MSRILFLAITVIFLLSCKNEPKTDYAQRPSKLVPVIEGDWWMIGPEPDLTELGLQPELSNVQPNQPNDHHVFQDTEGQWHLWACVRGTAIGRILAHWEADSLTQSPWHFTGDIIRADKSAGESLVEWHGQEFIQSPYIIEHQDSFFMFYGGYSTGMNPSGDTTTNYSHTENQISLMTSSNGRDWTRYTDARGYSRLFAGPGAARDPVVKKFGNLWYIYYCGHHNWDRTCGAIYVRTSEDLNHWSDWKIAHYDKTHENQKWLPESPQVVYRDGYYYLFRTHGLEGGTYVFRSREPVNFGHGDVSELFVTRFDIIAPEIITDKKGNEYITNISSGGIFGIRMTRLNWVREEYTTTKQ